VLGYWQYKKRKRAMKSGKKTFSLFSGSASNPFQILRSVSVSLGTKKFIY
jgi:hypothetical protein